MASLKVTVNITGPITSDGRVSTSNPLKHTLWLSRKTVVICFVTGMAWMLQMVMVTIVWVVLSSRIWSCETGLSLQNFICNSGHFGWLGSFCITFISNSRSCVGRVCWRTDFKDHDKVRGNWIWRHSCCHHCGHFCHRSWFHSCRRRSNSCCCSCRCWTSCRRSWSGSRCEWLQNRRGMKRVLDSFRWLCRTSHRSCFLRS